MVGRRRLKLLHRLVDLRRRQRDQAVALTFEAQGELSEARTVEREGQENVVELYADWRHAVSPKVDVGRMEQLQEEIDLGGSWVTEAQERVHTVVETLKAARGVARDAVKRLEAAERLLKSQHEAFLRDVAKAEQRQVEDAIHSAKEHAR